jgi:Pyridoxamine 5'-phosphate oxidase
VLCPDRDATRPFVRPAVTPEPGPDRRPGAGCHAESVLGAAAAAGSLRAMAQELPALTDKLIAWIGEQPVFFVASAPSGPDGHVNLSPKGLDSLRVLDPTHVAYLDLTGSGAETIAHLRENGRITVMWCAFEGPARILRLAGQGEVVTPDDPRFAGLAGRFPAHPGARAVIVVEADRIATSCGHAVPQMRLEGDRDQLIRWAENRGAEGLATYRAEKNATSIDGLPALDPAPTGAPA